MQVINIQEKDNIIGHQRERVLKLAEERWVQK